MKRPAIRCSPPALVHEAWMRLGGSDAPTFQNRAHFLGAAAEAMRRILIEHARRRLAAKRGAGVEVVDLDEIEIPSPVADDDQLLAVNEALEKFAVLDPRKADLVKLRYFVGMSFEEAATALDIAVPTAKQWWAYARAWLTVELGGGGVCGRQTQAGGAAPGSGPRAGGVLGSHPTGTTTGALRRTRRHLRLERLARWTLGLRQ